MAKKKKAQKPDYFFGGGGYIPERDGPIQEYLRTHNGMSSFPTFRGYKWFEILKKEQYFLPEYSIIRLMWNTGRGDQHFMITKDFQLEGIVCDNFHGGIPGIHDPKKLLKEEGPNWEAQHLNYKKVNGLKE